MPIEICASFGGSIPVADRRVERWRVDALRRSASTRVAQASAVISSAAGPALRQDRWRRVDQ
jgi:hypothetical protein